MILKVAEEPTAKKGKFYKSKYHDEWATLYPIPPGNENSFAFYCIPCKKNVWHSHTGLADVKQHCKRKTHLKMANAVKECCKLAQCCILLSMMHKFMQKCCTITSSLSITFHFRWQIT